MTTWFLRSTLALSLSVYDVSLCKMKQEYTSGKHFSWRYSVGYELVLTHFSRNCVKEVLGQIDRYYCKITQIFCISWRFDFTEFTVQSKISEVVLKLPAALYCFICGSAACMHVCFHEKLWPWCTYHQLLLTLVWLDCLQLYSSMCKS